MEVLALVVSVVAAGLAGVSAVSAVQSRKEAEAANHRAETPRIEVTCDGKYGNSPGLTARVRIDRDLDSMRVSLIESMKDGQDLGFQGLFVDQVKNVATPFKYDGMEVTFRNVVAGRFLVIVAQDPGARHVPKTARLTFRFECTAGSQKWTVTESTGDVDVHYSST